MSGDVATAARQIAARFEAAKRAGHTDIALQLREVAAFLPVLDAIAAGQDDAGRVERWARMLCAGDKLNPDTDWSEAMLNLSLPLPYLAWRAYERKARVAIALADAERAHADR